MQRLTFLSFLFLSTMLLAPTLGRAVRAQDTKTIWVAHQRVDCIGVAPQECYLIKDIQYEDWRFWYGEIEGFEFEEGYAYELLVREHRDEDPPADAPAVRLELVEIVLKVEALESSEPATRAPSPSQAPAPIERPVASETPIVEVETIPLEEPSAPVSVVPDPEPEPAAPTSLAPVALNPEPEPEPIVEPAPPPPAEPAPLPPPATPPAPSAPSATSPPATTRGEILRGHLTIGAGVEARSFKRCGSTESLWVEDRTDADLWGLYRRLAGYPNRPVFMEVSGDISAAPPTGFGSHFEQQIRIQEVRNASVESAGCFAEPDRFSFRASGNEPFWNVEISRRGLAFTELGTEERLLFPYEPPTFFGDQIIYRSQIAGRELRTLVVRLEPRTCNDSMADSTFSFTASVKLDGRQLEGCARPGEDEP